MSVTRWCRALDVLGVRRLPLVRDLVAAGRLPSPYETTAKVANRLGVMLRQIEQSNAGQNWLSLLLTYLLEALLADPVYGGNPDGIGWQWLEHQSGFPRPPADKTWYRLGRPVYYRRKA